MRAQFIPAPLPQPPFIAPKIVANATP
jgi:hypothetical protein